MLVNAHLQTIEGLFGFVSNIENFLAYAVGLYGRPGTTMIKQQAHTMTFSSLFQSSPVFTLQADVCSEPCLLGVSSAAAVGVFSIQSISVMSWWAALTGLTEQRDFTPWPNWC